jgi:serine/threonine protein kinase
MLECLKQVHSLNFLHRDVKPANFMVKDGRVYIMDFGIGIDYMTKGDVRMHIPEEKRSHFIGTPHYSSMRSHEMMNQSRRDDLESLAYAILFLLTNNGHYSWMEFEFNN